MTNTNTREHDEIWFVYDGDCPVCSLAARTWRIRETVGTLHLVNARGDKSHPVMQEIQTQKLNLDDGMVIKFSDRYYHGPDALHVMALLGTDTGWVNRFNVFVFRSKLFSALCYPLLRAMRNLLLQIKGVPPIGNLENNR
jgi:predicted DCC family thiol-disulfide oxidoreductase YuxK